MALRYLSVWSSCYFVVFSVLRNFSSIFHVCKLKEDSDIVPPIMVPFGHANCCCEWPEMLRLSLLFHGGIKSLSKSVGGLPWWFSG